MAAEHTSKKKPQGTKVNPDAAESLATVMTTIGLKAICKKMGLSTKGSKIDLAKRIVVANKSPSLKLDRTRLLGSKSKSKSPSGDKHGAKARAEARRDVIGDGLALLSQALDTLSTMKLP